MSSLCLRLHAVLMLCVTDSPAGKVLLAVVLVGYGQLLAALGTA